MKPVNIQFGQIPFWAIQKFHERHKLEIVAFSYICAKRFRDTGEAECSRAEIIEYARIDKSALSRALKKLIEICWIAPLGKNRWFIPDSEPEKVDESSTKSCQIVNGSAEKVDDLTTFAAESEVFSETKVDESSTNEEKKLSNRQQKVDESSTKSCQIVNESEIPPNPPIGNTHHHTVQTESRTPCARAGAGLDATDSSPPLTKNEFTEAVFEHFREIQKVNQLRGETLYLEPVGWIYDQNFTLDDVKDCYKDLRADITRRYRITPETISKELPDWKRRQELLAEETEEPNGNFDNGKRNTKFDRGSSSGGGAAKPKRVDLSRFKGPDDA